MRCDVCEDTNDYPKKLNGTYEDMDVYIDCSFGNKVFYFGHAVLEAYIPSLGRGRNLIRQIYYSNINPNNVTVSTTEGRTSYQIIDQDQFKKDINKSDIISDIIETDSEITFRFPYKYSDKIIPLLKPKTSAADRSPFSAKNLPKANYVISEEELREYTNIIEPLKADGKLLMLNTLTQNYLNKLSKNKAYRGTDLKTIMRKKMLGKKEFIHSENLWDDYLKFLKENIGGI